MGPGGNLARDPICSGPPLSIIDSMPPTGEGPASYRRALAALALCGLAASAGFCGAPPKITFGLPVAGNPWKRHLRADADPALSARHLPASLEVKDANQLRLFRALAALIPFDSTRHWELAAGRLRISYDF